MNKQEKRQKKVDSLSLSLLISMHASLFLWDDSPPVSVLPSSKMKEEQIEREKKPSSSSHDQGLMMMIMTGRWWWVAGIPFPSSHKKRSSNRRCNREKNRKEGNTRRWREQRMGYSRNKLCLSLSFGLLRLFFIHWNARSKGLYFVDKRQKYYYNFWCCFCCWRNNYRLNLSRYSSSRESLLPLRKEKMMAMMMMEWVTLSRLILLPQRESGKNTLSKK